MTPSSFSQAARWPVSADGRFVVFTTRAGDVVAPAQGGAETLDVFVRDLQNGTTALVNVNAAGTAPGNGLSTPVAISSDGRYVLFSSDASDLVANDGDGATDVFVRDLQLGTTELVSVAMSGTASGNGSSIAAAMSPDGRFVLFTSSASDLVAADGNGNASDAFVRDRQTGSTVLASLSTAETPGDRGSIAVAVSSDGRYVTFDSDATNFAGGDANNRIDVFRRDLQTGTTDLVSFNSAGSGTGNEVSNAVAMSAGGRFVLFASYASNLVPADGNSISDVFVRDLQMGVTHLVTVNTGGTAAAAGGTAAAISDDGRYVAFWSWANDLVAGDPGHMDVFVRDLQTHTTALVSVDSNESPGDGDSTISPGRMSGDGRFVLFDSHSNLTAGDANGEPDVFLRDRLLGTTTLVSAAPGGPPGNSSSGGSALTPDGRYAVFISNSTDLVAGDDGNLYPDIFERDVQTATTALVSARAALPAGASGNRRALPDAISGDGRYVVFWSWASDLVSDDANLLIDVFRRDLRTGTTALASGNFAGDDGGSGESFGAGVSFDGRYVLFYSWAGNLVAAGIDGNGTKDVFVRDMEAGITALVSATPEGVSGDHESTPHAITPSGRHVLFRSRASNLLPLDDGHGQDVFVRDLQTGVTDLVTVNLTATGGGNGFSWPVGITPDGRYVLFQSPASNLVTAPNGGFQQVYVRDRQAGTTAMVSVAAAGTAGGGAAAYAAAISADGRYVLFSSAAGDLVGGDGNGTTDVFVRDRQTGTTTLVSRNGAGTGPGNNFSLAAALSADGRYVLFSSAASDLVPDDGNGLSDVFRHDRQTGSTVLVSVDAAGSASANERSWPVSMSSDGLVVAFESDASNLVSGDLNGRTDAFVRDLESGTTTLESTSVAGIAGTGEWPLCCLASNGTRVVFKSLGSDLVPNDFNGTTDVFAAATSRALFADDFESGTSAAWSAVAP